MRLFSGKVQEGPSHPDWGRLGVVRAAGAALMAGASGPIGGPHTALCQRNPPAKLGSINKQYKPQG